MEGGNFFQFGNILSMINLISFELLAYRACGLSCVRLFGTPWTVSHQAPLSMEFSRQEYWRGSPFPTPADRPNPGIKPTSLLSAALASRFFAAEPLGKPRASVRQTLA